MYYDNNVSLEEFVGKTCTRVEKIGDDRIEFDCSDGSKYVMHHSQDCCESVMINDINGDLDFLVGSPICLADEATNNEHPKPSEWAEFFTWTFYRFGTKKGYVDIRWLGESNGYYSETASFSRTSEPTPIKVPQTLEEKVETLTEYLQWAIDCSYGFDDSSMYDEIRKYLNDSN